MEQGKELRASVIIRAYNAEATVKRTIESALAQKFPHDEYEIIIVDDGSTDGTSSIAASFGDDRIQLIRQENRGLAGAASTGVENARGDIISFLDADDEVLPRSISAAVSGLAQTSADYAYADYFEEYRGARTLVKPSDPFKAPLGAFVWRRNSFNTAGGFPEGTIFPEYDLLLGTWSSWSGMYINTPLFIYHRTEASVTGDPSRVADSIEHLRAKYPERAHEIAQIRSYRLPQDH